jgi:hypothetical protein
MSFAAELEEVPGRWAVMLVQTQNTASEVTAKEACDVNGPWFVPGALMQGSFGEPIEFVGCEGDSRIQSGGLEWDETGWVGDRSNRGPASS